MDNVALFAELNSPSQPLFSCQLHCIIFTWIKKYLGLDCNFIINIFFHFVKFLTRYFEIYSVFISNYCLITLAFLTVSFHSVREMLRLWSFGKFLLDFLWKTPQAYHLNISSILFMSRTFNSWIIIIFPKLSLKVFLFLLYSFIQSFWISFVFRIFSRDIHKHKPMRGFMRLSKRSGYLEQCLTLPLRLKILKQLLR